MPRPISEIAAEIRADWHPVHGDAEPFVAAMERLQGTQDRYYAVSAVEVLTRFQWAARTWKGAVARRIKTEIKDLLATIGSTATVLLLGLTLISCAGSAFRQERNARTDYDQANAAYVACLNANPTNVHACDASRLAYGSPRAPLAELE